MSTINICSVTFTLQEGGEIVKVPYAASGEISCSVRTVELDGGYAYYISATSKESFSADEAISFALPTPDTGDFLAIINHSPYWCRPFWGRSLCELPKCTQELLIRKDGRYVCYLPVVSDTYKTLLRAGDGGAEAYLYSNVRGLTDIRDQLALICLEGDEPLSLMEKIAKTAADLLGTGLRMRAERTYPEVLEYLGWCSWDALQIRVNHEDLLRKAREFKDKRVPIGFAIIDDMWADAPLLSYIPRDAARGPMIRTMHASMLRSFEGDPKRFPRGMGAVIEDLKQEGIPRVGLWFPTTGYWSGLQPGGEIAEALRGVTVVTEDKRQIIAAPEEDKALGYFDELCTRAARWGSDFVKIDNQGYHTRYRNLAPIGQSARAIQRAIDRSTEKYFGGALINCMGMPSECMFNRPTSAVSRCSDDFQPESRPWFAKNVLQCSYNGLLQGRYYTNDWDMWWTDDEQARKNSLCRAVSGGPIYISDEIGRTNPAILRPLALGDGRILRCDESATPTADCLMDDPTASGRVFKIRNRVGEAAVLCALNIDTKGGTVTGSVSVADVLLDGERYVAYEYFSKTAAEIRAGETLPITLTDNDDFRLYTLIPKGEDFTVIGRTDLLIGVKAAERHGNRITLLEGGEITIYSDEPVAVMAEGMAVKVVRSDKLTRFVLPKETTEFEVVI